MLKLTYRIGLALLCRKIREKLTRSSEKTARAVITTMKVAVNDTRRTRLATAHAYERERGREGDSPVLGSFTLNQLYVTKEINLMYEPQMDDCVVCAAEQQKRDFLPVRPNDRRSVGNFTNHSRAL